MTRRAAFFLFFVLASEVAAAKIPSVILPFPLDSHGQWWRLQLGRSPRNWVRFLGKDYVNQNSGPACVVMLLDYKKGAGISLDFASFANPRVPLVHADARWKFCRDNPEKTYPGGFAPDDRAEATGAEMAEVLGGEGIAATLLTGIDKIDVKTIPGIIAGHKMAVCHVDPAAYFSDEKLGTRRWVVVFGADATSFLIHDPGRPEGKSLIVPQATFVAALRGSDEGRTAELLECITLVGVYGDGWHADGRSSLFDDAFKIYGKAIGFPVDNGGSIYIHSIGLVTLQDFRRPIAKPRSVNEGRSFLAYNPDKTKVYLVTGEVCEKYFDKWAFDKLGAPTSDERLTDFGRRQDFENGYILSTGKDVILHLNPAPKPPEKKKSER
jgi:hypothetical protein